MTEAAGLRVLVSAADPQLRDRLAEAVTCGWGGPPVQVELGEQPATDGAHAAVVVCPQATPEDVARLRDGRDDLAILALRDSEEAETCAALLEAGADDVVPVQALRDGVLGRRLHVAVKRRSSRPEAAFASALDGMLIVDDARRVVVANRAAAELLGLSAREMESLRLDDINADDPGAVEAAFGRLLAEGHLTGMFTAVRSDGTRAYLEFSATASVAPGCHLAIARDVSDRRRSDAAAAAAREQLQSVIDGIPSMVWIKDLEGRIRFANTAVEAIFDVEPGWLIGRDDTAILSPEEVAQVRANDLHVVRTGRELVTEEDVVIRGDRRTLLVQKFPLRDADGKITGVCGVGTDITDRERLLALTRDQARRDAAVAELGRRALAGDDASEIVTASADLVADVLGADRTEVLELTGGTGSALRRRAGPGWEDVADARVPGGTGSLAGYALGRGEAVSVEDLRRDGEPAVPGLLSEHGVVAAAVVPVVLEEGPWGVVSAMWHRARPIGEPDLAFLQAVANVLGAAIARERAAELRRQLEQSRRLDALGQLAGGIAHDFNNLLAVILNYAQFVMDDVPEGSPAHADALNIRMAAERAAALTRRLLTFGSTKAGDDSVDATSAVRDLTGLLERTLGTHVTIETSLPDEPLVCQASATQIEQIILNLAVNARDAMPGGGTLRLCAERDDLDEGFPSAERGLEPGSYVRLVVADTGEGMTPETVARAFEPFFTTKPSGRGTGLGLTTVYSLSRQLGGTAAVASEPGNGTTVTVWLPVGDAPAPTTAEANAPPRATGQVILVVEDEDSVRRMVARVLSRHGYDIVEARDGAAGLRAASDISLSIDLVLTDVLMPQLTGPQLVEQVRRLHPGAAVLYMSGYAARMSDSDIGDDPVLEKPFSSRALLEAVAEAMPQRVP